MKADPLYQRAMQTASPHRDELDRLLDLRLAEAITQTEYLRDRAEVLRAFEKAATR